MAYPVVPLLLGGGLVWLVYKAHTDMSYKGGESSAKKSPTTVGACYECMTVVGSYYGSMPCCGCGSQTVVVTSPLPRSAPPGGGSVDSSTPPGGSYTAESPPMVYDDGGYIETQDDGPEPSWSPIYTAETPPSITEEEQYSGRVYLARDDEEPTYTIESTSTQNAQEAASLPPEQLSLSSTSLNNYGYG
jgi:hypothetical protein